MCYVWELSESCAESNVKIVEKMEDYMDDYKKQIIEVMEKVGIRS